MKKTFLFILGFISLSAGAQNIDAILNAKEVERIERTLSADDMLGRKPFTPGIEKAAAFIADEFKKSNLQTWKNSGTYLQEFVMVRPKFINANCTFNNISVDSKDVIVVTCKTHHDTSRLWQSAAGMVDAQHG